MIMKKQGLYLPEFEHDNCGAGFICSLTGKRSNDIIHKALEILVKLEHRGAVSADGVTGDGAGILIDIPHQFFKTYCDFELPEPGDYAVSNVFLPQKGNQKQFCIDIFEEEIKNQNLNLIGWRDVPVNTKILGEIAAETEPFIKQIFIGKPDEDNNDFNFQLKLFAARKIAEHRIYNSKLSQSSSFYLPSLSSKIIIFKGLLKPEHINEDEIDVLELLKKIYLEKRFIIKSSIIPPSLFSKKEYFEWLTFKFFKSAGIIFSKEFFSISFKKSCLSFYCSHFIWLRDI